MRRRRGYLIPIFGLLIVAYIFGFGAGIDWQKHNSDSPPVYIAPTTTTITTTTTIFPSLICHGVRTGLSEAIRNGLKGCHRG